MKLTEYNRVKPGTAKRLLGSTIYGCLIVMLFCIIFLSGCGGQNQKAAVQVVSAETETNEIARTMKVAEDVLGEMHFEIAKADLESGYIRTRPLAGAQFFEFWRKDNVGLRNTFLSNMHSIRRIVELNISKQDGKLNINCKVHVQRLSMPQMEITSSAQAYQLFTLSTPSLQTLYLNPVQEKSMTWINLQNDDKLEAEILKRISTVITKDKKEMIVHTESKGGVQ